MATANQETLSDETEEETRLKAELREMSEQKKALVNEMREPGERLLRISTEKRQKEDRLQQIRAERTERELRERYAAGMEAERKATNPEAVFGQYVLALKNENEQLKRQLDALSKTTETLKEDLQRTATFFRRQEIETREKEDEIVKLKMRVRCLEDEKSAANQISAETRRRQLDELRPPSENTDELEQILTELYQQQLQHQLPATEEHHPGNLEQQSTPVGLYVLDSITR